MSDNNPQPAGWYHAEGDPPNTERYWDGEIWQGEPQAKLTPNAPPMSPGQPPPAPGGPGAYTGQSYHSTPGYSEQSQATTALVMSIIGLVICGILGPIAWSIAQKEIDGIDAGRRDPANRGQAQAAKIIGMIVTAILVLGIVFLMVFVIAAG